MNQGLDLMGNPVGERTNFLIACACNPLADDLERELVRLERKVAEGAHVAFTQPVFETEVLETLFARIEHLPVKIMLGVIPLRSAKHAEFLHHEVPGMNIPDWIQNRMRSAENPSSEGVDIAVEFLEKVRSSFSDRIAGIYLMPPFKRYDLAVEIIERVGIHNDVPFAQ
jgi:homocysteine S-methyltransferase